MNRAEFALDRVALGTIDTLRQAGGIDLVGFFLTLASYQDGMAGDGRLVFDSTTGAITTLGMSRERYYRLKGALERLGLYETHDGRIYLHQAPAVRMPNSAVRIPNAVMSLLQEEGPAQSPEEEEGACHRLSDGEPTCELEAIIAEAQARGFVRISRPQIVELDGYLSELDPDLALYAIEIMDGYGRRAWGPVLNQCRRWVENDIRTRGAAIEDHQARRGRLEAHQADRRNEAPMTASDYYAFIRQRLESGKTNVAREVARLRWTRPAAYAASLTFKRREELVRLADWSIRTGQPVAF